MLTIYSCEETSSRPASFNVCLDSIESRKKLSSQTMLPELTIEVLATIQISLWSQAAQQTLRAQLKVLIQAAFPKMTSHDLEQTISWYFQQPQNGFQRQVILVRDLSEKLIGLALFDSGEVEFRHQRLSSIYIINNTILPVYQGYGLGQALAAFVFSEWSPDVLLITCSQSASLYSWTTLPEKKLIPGYVAYPSLQNKNTVKTVVLLPAMDIDLVLSCFRPLYMGIMQGDTKRVEQAVRNMTVCMLRKGCYKPMYDFDPWKKDGRSDLIATALGATESDGILVVFEKLPMHNSDKRPRT